MKLLVNRFKGRLGYNIFNECKNKNIEVIGVNVEETPVSPYFFFAKVQRFNNSRMFREMLDKNRFERLSTCQDALSRYLKVINHDN